MVEITGSRRLAQLGSYAFDAIDRKVAELKERGLEPVDFGVGDPTIPTPEFVRQATAAGIEEFKSAGYPPYAGSLEFRRAAAQWTARRFGVELDPESEVVGTIGSKEAIFHFPEAILDPGDLVIGPDPGYPPYERGTLFAEGEMFRVPLSERYGFMPRLDTIPREVADRAKIFWLTHPNSPTGAIASPAYLEEWVAFCREHEIIAASDEAYTEIYFGDEPPRTALEFGRDGVIVFQSLSKRSAMTGYRVGWCAGDERLIARFRKVKTNIDSGSPWFVQAGAIAALADEEHVAAFREEYRAKRDVLVDAFERAGLPRSEPEATLYIWQRAPEGMTGVALAERLLQPDIAAVTLPGAALSSLPPEESEAGPYIRLALVPSLDDCRRVASRIAECLRP
ncbi:MAG: aminotransferase class I/II-fold pyridoxal phosphate-dependent enzyme [Planctomycetes bacterium]|nr:aminotransferase class I/II-fold pyridoxal phosphate-dependent enzyme [Planctomycetota bacterium]